MKSQNKSEKHNDGLYTTDFSYHLDDDPNDLEVCCYEESSDERLGSALAYLDAAGCCHNCEVA